jgi:transcriptional regulator with XRE-family HTH domain
MARAALRWTVRELADRARINHNTVIRFENEKHDANEVTVLAIKAAFEAAGIRFEGSGVFPPEKEASDQK